MSQQGIRGQYRADCRLFIAGLPKMSDPRHILPYFSQFGPVRISRERSAAEDFRKREKGHCVLECADPLIAARIAQARNFEVFGRTVTALPLKSGLQLIKENSMLNSSRIILKKIPKNYSQEELRWTLEQIYGPVRTLFKFEPDHAKLKSDPAMERLYRRYDSYSAIFEDQDAAQALIETGCLDLGGGKIAIVEKFKLRKKIKEKETESIEGNVFGKSIPSQNHTIKITLNPTACQNELQTSRQTQIYSLKRFSDLYHYDKPSSRNYHERQHPHSPKDVLNRNHNHINMRFNKKSRVHKPKHGHHV